MKGSFFTLLVAVGLCHGAAQAAEVAVQWKDFKEYRDVYPSNEARGGYHKRIATQFEKHLNKLAEQLPAGYNLAVSFDDIDLAGDVHYGRNDIRVIKPIHFPSLTISYTLKDNSGKVLSEGQAVRLKDMSFMDRSRLGDNESFHYDKRLLSEWFEQTILPATTKSAS
ncbi:DUF3016 domain-containing protein [Pseudoalteromonas xiamenensis]|uniref:DUF3016 domain-containing protein n=1 Tax=Pseudoalteromonas xiamenensis TaxID=882626 RepID=A0A975DH22_9GAMM|nr:DUF3016 domain-containing protein [Pseudoalteromonas xiamenensis]QTH70161.1 DUF3016 domain-containing protein [Pseudoalteromonas xiamenensis]